MKTLDEAIGVFCLTMTPEKRTAILEDEAAGIPRPPSREQDNADRYRELMDEIYHHSMVEDLATQLIERLDLGTVCCLKHALIRAFRQGVMVGIEMEKPEPANVQPGEATPHAGGK
jgi:hypothetical protein